ncbi:hypothetical protein HHK36_031973 [Tetracentron sinense]|uniref:Uncharacterized protein n=1 Tax=Tetracentron sinense TaxID=13715 RepID=A0A834Y849_TETSI|nr:hypothetical protein HHK36_031973 [Tetracentron sinense]
MPFIFIQDTTLFSPPTLHLPNKVCRIPARWFSQLPSGTFNPFSNGTKAVLTLCLRKQGRELTILEIRDTLIPYLETLLEEHGDILVDIVESFPNSPIKEKSIAPASATNSILNSKKLKAIAQVSEIGLDGQLPPHVLYLIDLGMDLYQLKRIARKFPDFAYYRLEEKIKPVVEFLLDLGVSQSDIPTILNKIPQLGATSLSENLIPTMTYSDNLGVDKKQWVKVIQRSPSLLTYRLPL